MRLAGRTAILAIIILGAGLAANGQPSSPDAQADGGSAGKKMVLVPIQMNQVPLDVAVTKLAQQAHINVIIDERLINWWNMADDFGRDLHNEPVVSVRWTNITARVALQRVVEEHHLALLEDPVTSVARVTYPGQTLPAIDTSLFGSATNVIPLIEFNDVPLTVAWETLTRQADMDYILDPRIDAKPDPILNLHWDNLMAKQALIALYENGDWTISKDPASRIVLVRAKNHSVHFVDATLFGNDTKVIPLIDFNNVPLSVALENLAKQMNLKYALQLQPSNEPDGGIEPDLSVRWENMPAKEAFISLCDNYDLVIIKDPTGAIEVRPNE